jgi:hypothetical protein
MTNIIKNTAVFGILCVFLAALCVGFFYIAIYGFSGGAQSSAQNDYVSTKSDIENIQQGKKHTFILSKTRGTDELIDKVAVDELKEISLDRTDVTDAGINLLNKANNLNSITLLDCAMLTDKSMEYCGQFPSLEDLTLEETPISDKGIEALAASKSLKKLTIICNDTTIRAFSVTGKAFDSFKKMQDLEFLKIEGPFVTEKAVRDLHKSLPKTKIVAQSWEVKITLEP